MVCAPFVDVCEGVHTIIDSGKGANFFLELGRLGGVGQLGCQQVEGLLLIDRRGGGKEDCEDGSTGLRYLPGH